MPGEEHPWNKPVVPHDPVSFQLNMEGVVAYRAKEFEHELVVNEENGVSSRERRFNGLRDGPVLLTDPDDLYVPERQVIKNPAPFFPGCHFMHAPILPAVDLNSGCGTDILLNQAQSVLE